MEQPLRSRVTPTVPVRYRGRARRDAAAFYLGELGRGILAGEIVTAGDHPMRLAATEFVDLDIEVRRDKRADEVVVRIRWSTPAFDPMAR